MSLAAYDHQHRRDRGIELIGGVDEAGRGPLAGPVVAGVVVLGPEADLPGVNDSKQLKPATREAMVPAILDQARAWGLGLATPAEIDRINVLQATHLAAARALAMLVGSPDVHSLRGCTPEFIITDYLKLKDAPAPLLPIKKGDATSLAVAAASVLAKVARDRIMQLLDAEYPMYGFARHKGYGTKQHLAALREHGASTAHRLTFAGVCWFGEGATVQARSAGASSKPGLNGAGPRASASQVPWIELLNDPSTTLTPSPFLPDLT